MIIKNFKNKEVIYMTPENKQSLVDRKQLIELYPALGAKKYRLAHLVRTRQIPIIRIGKNIFYNPREIDIWIQNNQIKQEANNGSR